MRDARPSPIAIAVLGGVLMLSACGEDAAPVFTEQTRDPVLARVLHDPLMVDPDLAYRNEAAAALTTSVGQPIPVLAGNETLARFARDEARLELLKDGEIIDLPEVEFDVEGSNLADLNSAAEMALTLGAPAHCTEQLLAGFKWAARLEKPASIMPHGHVRTSAGFDSGKCSMRVVRYLTPAERDAALEYHFNLASRAKMSVEIYNSPENAMIAKSENVTLAINVRDAADAMRMVDVVYWKAE